MWSQNTSKSENNIENENLILIHAKSQMSVNITHQKDIINTLSEMNDILHDKLLDNCDSNDRLNDIIYNEFMKHIERTENSIQSLENDISELKLPKPSVYKRVKMTIKNKINRIKVLCSKISEFGISGKSVIRNNVNKCIQHINIRYKNFKGGVYNCKLKIQNKYKKFKTTIQTIMLNMGTVYVTYKIHRKYV